MSLVSHYGCRGNIYIAVVAIVGVFRAREADFVFDMVKPIRAKCGI